MSNHERVVGTDWVVTLQGHSHAVEIAADRQGATVTFDDGTVRRVASDWTPGNSLAVLDVDGRRMALKVDSRTEGFRIRYRGADLDVKVRSPRAAELARLMPKKSPPDTSKMLLCPMPGIVVSIAVAEGDEVQEGQALATVEAMKMENVLRAEKKATVKAIKAAPGASLAVDEVIMEFE
jgi:propionyl-CoA carboxylase alpha chain